MYGYSLREAGTEAELVNLRVTVLGITDKPAMKFMTRIDDDIAACEKGRRQVYLPSEGKFAEVPVYDGERLQFGHQGSGPAIIEQITTTTFVSPEFDFVVDRAGSYCLYLREIGHTYLRRVLE